MKLTLLETVASRLDPRLRLCSWEGPGWGAAVRCLLDFVPE